MDESKQRITECGGRRIGNGRVRAEKTSQYHGVSWHRTRKRWISRYARNGYQVEVGSYLCEHEAAMALAEAVIDRELDTLKTAYRRKEESSGPSKKEMETLLRTRDNYVKLIKESMISCCKKS